MKRGLEGSLESQKQPFKGFFEKNLINLVFLQELNSFAVATLLLPQGTFMLLAKNTYT